MFIFSQNFIILLFQLLYFSNSLFIFSSLVVSFADLSDDAEESAAWMKEHKVCICKPKTNSKINKQVVLWKVSKYRVCYDLYFPVFGLNMEIYCVNFRIPNAGKYWPELDKTQHRDTFHTVQGNACSKSPAKTVENVVKSCFSTGDHDKVLVCRLEFFRLPWTYFSC